jgi:hypothetical protein
MRALPAFWITGPFLVAALLFVTGCGQASPADNANRSLSKAQARLAAKRFATALLESPTRRAAVLAARDMGGPGLGDYVGDEYSGFRNARQHLDRVDDGCPASDAPAGSGPCLALELHGEAVPDPGNPGYATISFGTLWVRISSTTPIRVQDFTYRGGARECQLGSNCR